MDHDAGDAGWQAHAHGIAQALLIGVGNRYRMDDGAGPMVAEWVAQLVPDLRVIEHSGEGASLIELWTPADEVVVVDAARPAGRPGRITNFDAGCASLPTEFFHYSSHAFGVAEGIETARTLGRLPRSLRVFAIEGESFDHGVGLSARVEDAAWALARQLAHGYAMPQGV